MAGQTIHLEFQRQIIFTWGCKFINSKSCALVITERSIQQKLIAFQCLRDSGGILNDPNAQVNRNVSLMGRHFYGMFLQL